MDMEALRMQFVLEHPDNLQGIFEIALAEVERLKAENEKQKKLLRGLHRCPIHKPDGSIAWGCPDCVSELRDENKTRRKALEKFQHWHINNGLNDACANCGLDLRNEVHRRESLKEVSND